MRTRSFLLLLSLVVLLVATRSSARAQTVGQICSPETGFCLEGRFRQYWEQNGGLPVFGYPISPARAEKNRDTGQVYLTQWFERVRFELHLQSRPYDVLLGRIGDDELRRQGRDWQASPKESPQDGCRFFPETSHNVCGEFLAYWRSHGLQIDGRASVTEAESLALFGMPLTSATLEVQEDGEQRLVQWFERARFEFHPNKPDPYKVLLGLLGRLTYDHTEHVLGGVVVLSFSEVTTFGRRVVGEVRNDTNHNVWAGPALGGGGGLTNLAVLKPGGRSSFDQFLGAARIEDVSILWNATDKVPVTELSVHNTRTDPDGTLYGEVWNDSPYTLRYISIDVTHYDAYGIVIGYGQSDSPVKRDEVLGPGQSAPFTAYFFGQRPITHTTIQVQGERIP